MKQKKLIGRKILATITMVAMCISLLPQAMIDVNAAGKRGMYLGTSVLEPDMNKAYDDMTYDGGYRMSYRVNQLQTVYFGNDVSKKWYVIARSSGAVALGGNTATLFATDSFEENVNYRDGEGEVTYASSHIK